MDNSAAQRTLSLKKTAACCITACLYSSKGAFPRVQGYPPQLLCVVSWYLVDFQGWLSTGRRRWCSIQYEIFPLQNKAAGEGDGEEAQLGVQEADSAPVEGVQSGECMP